MGVQEVSYFDDCLLWSRKGGDQRLLSVRDTH